MIKQYFVSRHAGAHEWAARQGFEVEVVTHFDPEVIVDGDIVIGTLPINLADRVCARGGRYLHLTLDLTPAARGVELTADRMEELGARLQEYRVSSPLEPATLDAVLAEVAAAMAESGSTLRHMQAIIHRAYMNAHPEKYS